MMNMSTELSPADTTAIILMYLSLPNITANPFALMRSTLWGYLITNPMATEYVYINIKTRPSPFMNA